MQTGHCEVKYEHWKLGERTVKVAFSELTAKSHITDGSGLDLQFDISVQQMRQLEALMKEDT